MDKFRAVALFLRVVELGSLTAAANSMGVSLTAVVRSLANLESHLNARLLNRTTRRIALTEEGRDYYERCQKIMADMEDAEASLSLKDRRPSGMIRITAPVLFGRLHVAPVTSEFLSEHNSMRAELLLVDRVVDLLEEGMDVAIRIGALADSSLMSIHLGETRRAVCASPAYLDRFGLPQTPSDLANHRCIGFTGLSPSPDWWSFNQGGKIKRVAVSPILLTNQVDSARDACIGGMGLGIFLDYQIKEALAQGSLVRVLPAYERPPAPITLLYSSARLLSPRVRFFLDWAAPRIRTRLAPPP